jgi:2-haloacid dehalogenase
MGPPKLANIKACVFDAYGTLFDVSSAAARCREELGDRWQALSDTWRQKQLQYTWLRSLMGRHADFWQVTADALDFAMATHGLANEGLRSRLMDLYLSLDAYPEVRAVLKALKGRGLKTAILSNGTPKMLAAAVESAGIGASLDAVLSVEEVGVFKPHPSVYRLGAERLGVAAGEIAFQSSNAWDAAGAAAFGYRVAWINRFRQAPERLPGRPDVELQSLHALPEIVA